jgi:hypothetical protein
MKTTVEIADDLLIRAKNRAKAQRITLQSLIEEALTMTLNQPPITPVTFKGNGLSREFEDASWDKIRETIYS